MRLFQNPIVGRDIKLMGSVLCGSLMVLSYSQPFGYNWGINRYDNTTRALSL